MVLFFPLIFRSYYLVAEGGGLRVLFRPLPLTEGFELLSAKKYTEVVP